MKNARSQGYVKVKEISTWKARNRKLGVPLNGQERTTIQECRTPGSLQNPDRDMMPAALPEGLPTKGDLLMAFLPASCFKKGRDALKEVVMQPQRSLLDALTRWQWHNWPMPLALSIQTIYDAMYFTYVNYVFHDPFRAEMFPSCFCSPLHFCLLLFQRSWHFYSKMHQEIFNFDTHEGFEMLHWTLGTQSAQLSSS